MAAAVADDSDADGCAVDGDDGFIVTSHAKFDAGEDEPERANSTGVC